MNSFITQAVIRHMIQALGAALITAGWLTAGQVGELTPLAIQIIGALMSAFSVLWGMRSQTERSLLTAAVQQPSVIKNKTKIVVSDPDLALKTPTEIIYGQDMSIQ